MARNFIEKRIVKEGVKLDRERRRRKEPPVSADDLKSLQVKTFSPWLQGFYIFVGTAFILFGVWTHHTLGNMAASFVPVLMGFGNILFALHGRPKRVDELGESIPLLDLSSEIAEESAADSERTA